MRVAALLLLAGLLPAPAVDLRWDRFYDYDDTVAALRELEAAHPGWLKLESLGKSVEGRDLWVAILCSPGGLPHRERPAIYIDANVHGNEIQGTETCLYTLWYLLEEKDRLPAVKELLDRVAFYVVPSVNPDGRQSWFDDPNTPHSPRSGLKPWDDDRDGAKDEDGPNDLDGDGSITWMRKRVKKDGTHVPDEDDPRILRPVKPGEVGTYVLLGHEGIDDDGDGRVNEDPPGGYDMNRNWPSDWQPAWIQWGAGPYPLSWPETRAVADFLLAHPNVAAVQSYHNSGGMILRGPGAREIGEYPRADLRVYDAIGKAGEEILPHYRYMTLWKDLYPVHGGFVTWAFEGLGVFSFTNELWSRDQYRGKKADEKLPRADRKVDRVRWDDEVEMGRQFRPWHEFDHPQYGKIEIGGFVKTSARVPPLFMLQELCHRNMAFTLHHAREMPELALDAPEVTSDVAGIWRVRATVRNRRLIPTVSAYARQKGIGLPDFFSIEVEGGVVVSGGLLAGEPLREKVRPQEHRPGRLVVPDGVPSHGLVRAEWLIRAEGERPPKVTVRYASEKGGRNERKGD